MALKDLLGGTIRSMLETELSAQIQEREEADPEYSDSRNGYKPKTLRSSMGEIPYPPAHSPRIRKKSNTEPVTRRIRRVCNHTRADMKIDA